MKHIHLSLFIALGLTASAHHAAATTAAEWLLNGNANDSQGHSNGVATNVQWVTLPNISGALTSMAYFDGTASISISPTSYLYMPNTGFSITAWIMADTFSGTGENSAYYILDAGGVPGSSESAFNFGFSDKNLHHQISGADDYPTNSQYGDIKWYQTGVPISQSHILDTNSWYLLGLTYDGANAHAYINGVEMTNFGTTTYPLNNVAPYQFTQPLRLGASHGGDPKFHGYIYDVSLYSTPLTSAEMAALVPEPASAALILVGTAFLAAHRRRAAHPKL